MDLESQTTLKNKANTESSAVQTLRLEFQWSSQSESTIILVEFAQILLLLTWQEKCEGPDMGGDLLWVIVLRDEARHGLRGHPGLERERTRDKNLYLSRVNHFQRRKTDKFCVLELDFSNKIHFARWGEIPWRGVFPFLNSPSHSSCPSQRGWRLTLTFQLLGSTRVEASLSAVLTAVQAGLLIVIGNLTFQTILEMCMK